MCERATGRAATRRGAQHRSEAKPESTRPLPRRKAGSGHTQEKKSMTKKKMIGLGLLTALLVMQFFQTDKTTQAVDPKQDFIALTRPDAAVEGMLRAACYDCHSQQTVFPFYTYINPLGWWIGAHVRNGRKKLDFSHWASYAPDKQAHKLEECVEEIEKGKMPLGSYTWTHGDARLTQEQRTQLIAWLNATRMRTGVAEEEYMPMPSTSD